MTTFASSGVRFKNLQRVSERNVLHGTANSIALSHSCHVVPKSALHVQLRCVIISRGVYVGTCTYMLALALSSRSVKSNSMLALNWIVTGHAPFDIS